MKLQKKLLLWGMLLLFIFILYKPLGIIRLPFVNISPYEMVLSNTALLFEVRDFDQLNQKMSDFDVAQKLAGTYLVQKFPEDFKLIEELHHQADVNQDYVQQHPFLAAVHQTGLEDLNFTFVFDQRNSGFNLSAFLKKLDNVNITESTFRKQKIYDLRFSNGQRMSIACVRNLVVMGRYALIVEDAINKYWSTHINLDPSFNFQKVRFFKNEDTDLCFFVNFKNLPELLTGVIRPSMKKQFSEIAGIGDWTAFEFEFKNNGIAVNGNFIAENNHQIIEALPGKSARSHKAMTKMIPSNVACFNWFGTGKFERFYDRIKRREDAEFEKYFLPWLGEEMAYVMLEPFSAAMQGEQFAVFEAPDEALASHYLKKYVEQVGELKSLEYQTYEISQIMTTDLLEPIFGESLLNSIHNPFYTFVDGYAVFGKSEQAMKQWIDQYLTGQTLSQDVHFLKYELQFKPRENTYFYVNADNALQLVRSFIQKPFLKYLDEEIERYKHLNQFGFNVHPEWNGMRINAFLEDEQHAEKETAIMWKTTLTREAIIPPAILKNPISGQNEILIQDKQNTVYLLNRGGDILWRRKLDHPILSDITQIDYSENGDLQFMFNTKKSIYLLDRKGKDVGHFPMKLSSPATNGMLVCDFTHRKEYRFFVACQNNNIYGFDKNGQPLTGWNPKMKVGQIPYAMKHFQRGNRDYLMALNSNGKLFVFKQNGDARFKATAFNESFISPPDFQMIKGANRIVSTDTNGRIHVVNMEGAYFKLNLGVGDNEVVRFIFSDVGGDLRKDYIGMSGNEMVGAYYNDGQFKELFKYKFEEEPNDIFKIEGVTQKDMIGVLSEEKAKISMIDGHGELYPGFPLAGSTKFRIVDLYDNRKDILVVGNGNSVYTYQLQQQEFVENEVEQQPLSAPLSDVRISN